MEFGVQHLGSLLFIYFYNSIVGWEGIWILNVSVGNIKKKSVELQSSWHIWIHLWREEKAECECLTSGFTWIFGFTFGEKKIEKNSNLASEYL